MAASTKPATGGVEEAGAEEEPRILEPGAAPFGNFPHYSRFHPPEQRLRLLPPELLRRLFPQSPESRPILGLDVGCNSGVSYVGGVGGLGAERSASSAFAGSLVWAWHHTHHSFPEMSLSSVPNSCVPSCVLAPSRPNLRWERPPFGGFRRLPPVQRGSRPGCRRGDFRTPTFGSVGLEWFPGRAEPGVTESRLELRFVCHTV